MVQGFGRLPRPVKPEKQVKPMPIKRKHRRVTPLLVAAVALAVCLARPADAAPEPSATGGSIPEPSAAGAIRDETGPQREALNRQIRAWIDALSAQEPFRNWADAVPRVESLGPGTHGWLVTLTERQSGRTAGYMVIYPDPDREGGFRLGEYGTGDAPLFGESALRHTLQANGYLTPTGGYAADKAYRHPFAAAWKVRIGKETYWLDAKTGEELPLNDRAWAKAAEAGKDRAGRPDRIPPVQPGETVASVRLNDVFDPYERLPWLTGEKAISADPAGPLLERLDAGLPVRFVTEPFGELMLYAVPVIGYVAWSGGRVDLVFDQNGPRVVPLDTMRDLGHFYR